MVETIGTMGDRKLPKQKAMPAVYRAWKASLSLAPKTIEDYGRGLRRVVGFADIEPEVFTPASLDQTTTDKALSEMERQVEDEKLLPGALHRSRTALRSFFEYCSKEGHLGDLVVPDIAGLRTGKLLEEAAMPAVYHAWIKSLPVKEETTVAYGQGLRRLVYFAKIEPEDLKPGALDQTTRNKAESKMRSEGVSDAALHQCRTALISFFDYCREKGLDVPGIDGHYLALPEEEAMPDVYRRWITSLPLREDKPETTTLAYGQGLRRLVYFAKIEPEDFTPGALDQVTVLKAVTEMRSEGVSKAALNQCLAALSSFFDYCSESEKSLLEGAAPPDIRRIRKLTKLAVDQVDPEYYRPSDIRDLFSTAATPVDRDGVRWPARDLAMCSFLAVLGLRASELYNANLDWLTQERLLEVDEAANWMLHVRGKGRKIRRLPLSQELLDVNDGWQSTRNERFGHATPDDPLFVTHEGARFNYQRLRYWLRKLNREAALRDRSLHALRHTAGVQLAADGVPMNVIQSLLGHASVATTGIYTELAGGELVGVLNRSEANTLLREALDGSTP